FYNGIWYIVEGYPNRFYDDSVCHEWSLATDGKYVYINETVFNVKKHDFDTLQGKARYQSKGGVNCLVLSPGIKSLPYGADMCIISTDYSNYGVMYVCRPFKGNKKQEYIYIMSRTPTLEPRLRARVLIDNIVRGGFQVTPFAPMNQLYCPLP
ncbi:apolipoprotein D-like, partial [Limulus polyphemus]|uniref:Apolipoprotein D-like n=1 Tax=Limulus polyphemus TaxID=6850 RepID=A0ABM1THP6_LIMPO